MAHSFWLTWVAVFLGMTTDSAENVATRRAAAELACPERNIEATCDGHAVFHSALQIHCHVRGCGQSAAYRCEAPLRRFGALEVRYGTTCE